MTKGKVNEITKGMFFHVKPFKTVSTSAGTDKSSVHKGINCRQTLISCLTGRCASLWLTFTSQLCTKGTLLTARVPYLFYARRREMSAAIERTTLKTLTTVPPVRLIDRECLLFRPRLCGGNKVNLTAVLLPRTLAQTWAGMQCLQVREVAVLFHADSAATCQRGEKVWLKLRWKVVIMLLQLF